MTVYGTFRLSDATKKRGPGPSIHFRSPPTASCGTQKNQLNKLLLHQQRSRSSPRLVPESEFYPIPKAELIVDDAQVILNHVFGGSDCLRDLLVFQAFGNELDDTVLTLAGDTVSITFVS